MPSNLGSISGEWEKKKVSRKTGKGNIGEKEDVPRREGKGVTRCFRVLNSAIWY